jgi:hypothetical protein
MLGSMGTRIVAGLTSLSGKIGLLWRKRVKTDPGQKWQEQAWQLETGGAALLLQTSDTPRRGTGGQMAGQRNPHRPR